MKFRYIEVKVDIDKLEEAPDLIEKSLRNWWNSSYLSDLNPNDNIPYVVEQWISKYVNSKDTQEAIEKIRKSGLPNSITMYLIVNLLTHDGFLRLEDEISTIPYFRPYIQGKYSYFSLDTYVYNPTTHKFESLESMTSDTLEDEEIPPELIRDFYSFHNRLLELTSKKLKLYTAQPEKRIEEWNKQGYIPKGSYLTDRIERAEYYYNPEENDVMVYYKVPENEVLMTSEFGGAKEYVTIVDVKIK